MDKFKSIFSYKKGSIGLGSSREKKEYLQAMAFMYIASCGGEARYRDVIEAIEIKIDSKIARRNIRGAIVDLKDRYPVEYLQNKQIEYLKINKNKLKKAILSKSQSNIIKYLYKSSSDIRNFFLNDFYINERQFYRYMNGERVIIDEEKILTLASYISTKLSDDKRFKYYPIFSLELLEAQIGYIFCKTTPLIVVNAKLEEILALSFMMNSKLLFFYLTKLSKELNFSSEEAFEIINTLSKDETKNISFDLNNYKDFYNIMDENGDFIDMQTIERAGQLGIKEKINLIPKIEKDIFSSMPLLFIECWELSKSLLEKLRIEINRQHNNKTIRKRDLLNDKLAGYFQ